eukprot:scaffold6195_cov428-Prasinococcus_capsulatus_cf.AAC.5
MGMLRSLVGAAAALSVGTWTVHAEDADVVWSVEHPPDVYTTLEISIFEIKFETTFPLVAFEVLVVEPSGDTVNIFSANMGQAGSNVVRTKAPPRRPGGRLLRESTRCA